MPQRPDAHIIGSRAAAAVALVVADAGYAVETVYNDYGEDLLVQTAHKGSMDANRLWIQVKGTANLESHRRRGGQLKQRFSYYHITRWLRSADPVLVVLWDVNSQEGYFAWPMEQVQAWKATLAREKRASLTFDQTFHKEALKELIWRGRIYHYWRLLQMAAAHDEESDAKHFEGEETNDVLPFGALRTHVLIDFLSLIGVVEAQQDAAKLNPEARGQFASLLVTAFQRGAVSVADKELYGGIFEAMAAILVEDYALRAAGLRLRPSRNLVPSHLLLGGAGVVKALIPKEDVGEIEKAMIAEFESPDGSGSDSAFASGLNTYWLASFFESHGITRVSAVMTDLEPGLLLLVHDAIDEGLRQFVTGMLTSLLEIYVCVTTDEEKWSDAEQVPLRELTTYTLPRKISTPQGDITLAAIHRVFSARGYDQVSLVLENPEPLAIFLIEGSVTISKSVRNAIEHDVSQLIGLDARVEIGENTRGCPLASLKSGKIIRPPDVD